MYHLLVKTLFDILESPKSSPSPKFLPGTLWIRVLTFTRRQIQPNWPFSERVTKQKRYFLFTLLYGWKLNWKSNLLPRPNTQKRSNQMSSRSMVARSIWQHRQKSYWWRKQKIMSSIRERARSSRVRKKQRYVNFLSTQKSIFFRWNQDTKKIFIRETIPLCGDHIGRAANGATPAVNHSSKALTV